MSEFFDKFSNENYKPAKEKENDPVLTEGTNVVKKGGISAVTHETVRDTAYAKAKTIRIVVLAAAAVLLFVGVVTMYLIFSRVTVINFVDKSVTEARSWAATKGITLDEETQFNDESTNVVLSQSIKAGDTMSGGDVLKLTVSKGPDPQEKITVPDFNTLTSAQIQSWIDDNKLTNTNIMQDNSDTVEADKVISVVYRDAGVNGDNFTRADYLVITVSKGPSMTNKVNVSNLVGLTKTEIDKWGSENNITISYKKTVSDTIPEGVAISQSTAAYSVVDRYSVIIVVLSVGKGVEVPNFTNYTLDTAATASDKIKITALGRYSDTVAYGKLISQSASAKSKLLPDENYVTVVYSIGRPYMENLTGKLEKDLAPYFFNFTSHGANISYSVSIVHSSLPKGTVTGSSRYGEFLSMTDSVTIYISDGAGT